MQKKEEEEEEGKAGARESRGISCVVGESLVTVHLLKELAVLLFQRARRRAVPRVIRRAVQKYLGT